MDALPEFRLLRPATLDDVLQARAQHPDDCVGAVLFLLSQDADFVTGQMLPVNGGFVFN